VRKIRPVNVKYILKKREYLGQVARAFDRYVGAGGYGPWKTVASAESAEAARAALSKRDGLTQYAIFHGGKRLEWIVR
jgi:hypothetical protein